MLLTDLSDTIYKEVLHVLKLLSITGQPNIGGRKFGGQTKGDGAMQSIKLSLPSIKNNAY